MADLPAAERWVPRGAWLVLAVACAEAPSVVPLPRDEIEATGISVVARQDNRILWRADARSFLGDSGGGAIAGVTWNHDGGGAGVVLQSSGGQIAFGHTDATFSDVRGTTRSGYTLRAPAASHVDGWVRATGPVRLAGPGLSLVGVGARAELRAHRIEVDGPVRGQLVLPAPR